VKLRLTRYNALKKGFITFSTKTSFKKKIVIESPLPKKNDGIYACYFG
jgi:hypothetical protein